MRLALPIVQLQNGGSQPNFHDFKERLTRRNATFAIRIRRWWIYKKAEFISLPQLFVTENSTASSTGENRSWWVFPRGRRRCLTGAADRPMAAPSILLFLCTASALLRIAESCSSRSTPKPRPPSPTLRPNITFQTFDCPEAYAKWYCLNGATCFSVRISESILYNCECADGFMGQRCEFKDLDGSYLPSRSRVMIETASIAGGVTVAILLIFVLLLLAYTYIRRCKKLRHTVTESCDSENKPINTSSCNNNKEPQLSPSQRQTARELDCGRVGRYTSTGPPYPTNIP